MARMGRQRVERVAARIRFQAVFRAFACDVLPSTSQAHTKQRRPDEAGWIEPSVRARTPDTGLPRTSSKSPARSAKNRSSSSRTTSDVIVRPAGSLTSIRITICRALPGARLPSNASRNSAASCRMARGPGRTRFREPKSRLMNSGAVLPRVRQHCPGEGHFTHIVCIAALLDLMRLTRGVQQCPKGNEKATNCPGGNFVTLS